MIVLGIDPGTAALGYGIVERTGGRLREVDHGCLVTSPDLALPERLLAIHALVDELLAPPPAGLMARRAAVLLAQRPDGVRASGRRAASCCWRPPSTGRRSARRPRTRSRAPSRATARPTRSRSSGWSSSCSGMSRACRDPTMPPTPWRSRPGRPTRSAAVGRSRSAAVAPITRTGLGAVARRSDARRVPSYDRGRLREALARRQRQRDRPAPIGQTSHDGTSLSRRRRTRAVIASVEGIVGAVAADSLVIEVGGIGYRVFAAPAIIASAAAGRPAQAPHVPPRPRGPAGAVRVPLGRGARVLQPAADRDRRRAEGRAGDRRAAGRRPTSSSRSWPRTRPSSSSIPGIGKKLAERIIFELKEKVAAAGVAAASGSVAAGSAPAEGEIVAALQALGYSLAEAREASRVALADAASAARSRSGSRPRCGACSATDVACAGDYGPAGRPGRRRGARAGRSRPGPAGRPARPASPCRGSRASRRGRRASRRAAGRSPRPGRSTARSSAARRSPAAPAPRRAAG